ncbi:MAG: protease modulator HflC [Spirochaetes bacterium]|uniref:Protein HflC n=1 Tax=Candidatus Ornithospirochaeta stercoravium TaxID=2840897 RepID=A0A9D9IBP7_9SPIO|nr:protease modulator HflC [Candidatus Ornithospirochaeta stercoravium]
MKKLWTILIVIIVLLILFLLLGPFYMVNEGEQAVITRFGRIVDTETTSGLKLKMPVIDTVTKYPKMLLSWDGDAQRIPTKENQFIWVDATARWRINDPALFYMTVKTVEGGIARLNDVLDSTIRTVISENYLNEAVRSTNRINSMEIEENVGSEVENAEDAETLRSLTSTRAVQEEIKIGRDGLSDMMLQDAAPLTLRYGIELEDVIIRQIRYSDDLTASVYSRMIKERSQIAETYRSYGRGQLLSWQGRTENDKKNILSKAYAESEKIKGDADAAATAIYSNAYSADPEFFRLWTLLESYRKTIPGIKDKTLSTSLDYFDYMYSSEGRSETSESL